jgi:hypothetical protein
MCDQPTVSSTQECGESATITDGRRETELERYDRNLNELMGELRVALPGVQVLFAFLLVAPFSSPSDSRRQAAQRRLRVHAP